MRLEGRGDGDNGSAMGLSASYISFPNVLLLRLSSPLSSYEATTAWCLLETDTLKRDRLQILLNGSLGFFYSCNTLLTK